MEMRDAEWDFKLKWMHRTILNSVFFSIEIMLIPKNLKVSNGIINSNQYIGHFWTMHSFSFENMFVPIGKTCKGQMTE